MATVTAEALLDEPCPRAGITIEGLGIGDSIVSVWRTADGERSSVRGARRTVMVDAAFIQDYDAPLERPVTYEVEVISGPTGASRVYADPVTVNSDTGWLMDPLIPQTAMPILGHKGADGQPYLRTPALSELEYAANVSLIDIMGSSAPMAQFGQVMKARGIPLHMSTRSAEQNALLKELLLSTAQFVFRPIPGFGVALPGTMHVSIPVKRELPVDVAMGGSLTVWEMTAGTVTAPVMQVLTATFTYGDVELLYETYLQKENSVIAAAAAAGEAPTYLFDMKHPFG